MAGRVGKEDACSGHVQEVYTVRCQLGKDIDDVEVVVVVVVGAVAVVGTTSVVATAGTIDAAAAISVDGAGLISALEPVQPEKARAASSEPKIARQPSDVKRLATVTSSATVRSRAPRPAVR